MKDITIVYKTYLNDLPWLKYSLLSLKKYVTNYKNINIYCHDEAYSQLCIMLEEINIECSIFKVHYDFHGYIKQMVVKCECYKDTDSKYIVILDSDNVFTDFFDISTLVNMDNKIEWLYLNKNDDPSSVVWTVWKKSYEDMTYTQQDIHFMANGFPFIFTRESMENAANKFKEIHNMDYSEFCMKRLHNQNIQINNSILDKFPILATIFEEFECLGYYCKNYCPDYVFISNKNNTRKIWSKLKQYWSHGGINNEIKKELEQIIK